MPDSWFTASPPLLAWLVSVLVLAALARGYAGFGFSAVLVTGWSLATDPVRAVVLALLLEVAASVVQARSVWQAVPWRRVAALLVAAAVGTPVGVWLLGHADAQALRVGLALFVFGAAIAMLAGWRLARRAGTPATLAAGFASGVANGAVAMGGLPVALFFTADGEDPARMRAAMIAYFFVLDLLALLWIARAGLVGGGDFVGAAAALPLVVGGMALGARRFATARVGDFRRFTLWLLLTLSVAGLARALS